MNHKVNNIKEVDSLFFLRLFPDYNHDSKQLKVPFNYQNKNAPQLVKLRKKLQLDNIITGKKELNIILNLLKWANKFLRFNGKVIPDRRYDNDDWFEIINKAKAEGFTLNCRYISLLFTQVLLAVGFKARWVTCLPIDIVSKERHCVTEVYVQTYQKWVVVDAAYNLLYFNKKGELLNLLEMRKHIIKGEKFRFLTKTLEDYEYIWNCWVNHIFRFQYILDNKYNMLADKNKKFAFLNPKNFLSFDENINNLDLKKTTIYNYDDERPFLKL